MWKTRMDKWGRVAIPMELRQRGDFAPGVELVMAVEGEGEVLVTTVPAARRKAQAMVPGSPVDGRGK